ncbi:MAG: class I SAM-dependent methyltransferase [Candidatus Dormibacteria bacterium]
MIRGALGAVRTVVNVGAGTGSYEPENCEVTAVEPSSVMNAQRWRGAASVVQATAERLPFADGAFDASMAILSDHHWTDRLAGLRELRRVARSRVVLFQWDIRYVDSFWLTRDYLPDFRRRAARGMTADDLARAIGRASVETFPIPFDLQDGFLSAYWRRPEAYLDADVLANISVFALMPPSDVDAFASRLRADLESGAWQRRNAEILDLTELDLGYRLIVGS